MPGAAAASWPHEPVTRVAVFTDNDFDKVNGVTTTLTAVLRTRPPTQPAHLHGARLRRRPAATTSRCVVGVGIPFYREMKMYCRPCARASSAGCAATAST